MVLLTEDWGVLGWATELCDELFVVLFVVLLVTEEETKLLDCTTTFGCTLLEGFTFFWNVLEKGEATTFVIN